MLVAHVRLRKKEENMARKKVHVNKLNQNKLSSERKRLARCGICKPCQIKIDCGKCTNCIHRSTGKQACILRKCSLILEIQLARKVLEGKVKRVNKHKSVKIKEESKQLKDTSLDTKLKNCKSKTIKDDKANAYPFESNPSAVKNKNQLYPQIVEPRIFNHERCSVLRKNVKPVNQGIASLLPSFQNFHGKVKSSPLKRKSLSEPNTPNKTKGRKGTKKKLEELTCGCQINQEQQKSPFYTHLGSSSSVSELHDELSKRYGVSKDSINVKLIKATSREGKNGDGCPLARWIVRRSGPDEKYLVIVKQHEDHSCKHKINVVAIVAWEGITEKYADQLYEYLTSNLNDGGFRTRRRCGTNDSKTCLCQGTDEESTGASFTFGCSWSMFFDGCKFAKSTSARKFKMQDATREKYMETVLQTMTTNVSPLLKVLAPEAFNNMTKYESVASDCRIGNNEDGRPFSGVTCCLDFCAHSHKDQHNMNNGTTMVCTLLKPDYNERADEQLHVLPLYQLCDDLGNVVPTNFEIPNHFMQSTLQNKQEPFEGKGRYVCPEAVNKKAKVEENVEVQDEQKIKFVDERTLHSVFDESMKAFSMFLNGHTDTLMPSSLQNGDPKLQNTFPSILPNGDMKTQNVPPDSFNKTEDFPSHKHDSSSMSDQRLPESNPTIISDDMGGVAIALGHGSFLIECAKKELHATTALKNPCRSKPTRLSMVFYQHKKLDQRKHGYYVYAEKEKQRRESRQSFDDLHLLNTQNDTNSEFDSPEKTLTSPRFPHQYTPENKANDSKKTLQDFAHKETKKNSSESNLGQAISNKSSSISTISTTSNSEIRLTPTTNEFGLNLSTQTNSGNITQTTTNSEPCIRHLSLRNVEETSIATRIAKQISITDYLKPQEPMDNSTSNANVHKHTKTTDHPILGHTMQPDSSRDKFSVSRFSVDSLIGTASLNDNLGNRHGNGTSQTNANFAIGTSSISTHLQNVSRSNQSNLGDHQHKNGTNSSALNQSNYQQSNGIDQSTFSQPKLGKYQQIEQRSVTNSDPLTYSNIGNHQNSNGTNLTQESFPRNKPSVIRFNHIASSEIPAPYAQTSFAHHQDSAHETLQKRYEQTQQNNFLSHQTQNSVNNQDKPHTLLDHHNEIMKHFSMGLPTSPTESFLSPVNPLPEDILRALQGKNIIPSPVSDTPIDKQHPFYRPPFVPPPYFGGTPVTNEPPKFDQNRLEQIAAHIHSRNMLFNTPHFGEQPPTYPTQGRPDHPLSLLDRHANLFVRNSIDENMHEHYGYSKLRPDSTRHTPGTQRQINGTSRHILEPFCQPELSKKPVHPSVMLNMRLKGPHQTF